MIALLLAGLTIASDPPRMQLGETPKARLRIQAPSEPRLSASTGRIENLRPAGDGRWEADYLPPDDSVPQLALIASVAPPRGKTRSAPTGRSEADGIRRGFSKARQQGRARDLPRRRSIPEA